MYLFNSVGCIIELLRVYCNNIADKCTIGNGKVKYLDKVIATVTLEEHSEFPVLDFVDEYSHLNDVQKDKRWEVIRRLFGYPIYSVSFFDECYYLGFIEYYKPFSSAITRAELYFDYDRKKIIAVHKDGEVTQSNFFVLKDSKADEESIKRAWAIINTKIPDDEKRPRCSTK